METVVEFIGFNGPALVCFGNLFVLVKYTYHFIAYILLLVFNKILNGILKRYIKEPRPNGNQLITGEFDKANYKGQYGMPSGHSQYIFFSAFYTWFVVQNNDLLLLEMFVGLITVYQRWAFRRHGVKQLFAGAALGIFISFFYKFFF